MAQGRLSWLRSAWKLRLQDLHSPTAYGWLGKIWSHTLVTGTLQQVNFALKMLQNQMGNQRSCWNAQPWKYSKFYWVQTWKISPAFKAGSALVRRLTQITSRSTPQSKLLYDSKNWKDQCKFHSVADVNRQVPVTLCCVTLFQLLQIIPIISTILPLQSPLPMVQAAQAFSYSSVRSTNPKSNGTEGQQWHLSLCKQSCQIPGPSFCKKSLKTQFVISCTTQAQAIFSSSQQLR